MEIRNLIYHLNYFNSFGICRGWTRQYFQLTWFQWLTEKFQSQYHQFPMYSFQLVCQCWRWAKLTWKWSCLPTWLRTFNVYLIVKIHVKWTALKKKITEEYLVLSLIYVNYIFYLGVICDCQWMSSLFYETIGQMSANFPCCIISSWNKWQNITFSCFEYLKYSMKF